MENNTNESFYAGMPSLQAKEMELDNKVENIKGEISKIKKHPRFESNPSERDYQISELEAELETTLTEAEEDFQIELDVTEQHLATQMFDAPKVDAETAQAADTLAQDIATQVQLSAAVDDTLVMLAVRVKTMDDSQKHSLLKKLPIITQEAQAKKSLNNGADIDMHLEAINNAVNNTAHKRSITEQLDALKRIKKGGASVTSKYRQQELVRKIAQQDIPGQSGISREFYEQMKGGRN